MKNRLLVLLILFLIAGCNTSESEGEQEDKEYEELSKKAAAYALSPENVARQASIYSSASDSGGSNGSFLWKPISESDGNLVVLLPSSMSNVNRITVTGSGGSATAGRGAIGNGGRPHYRFNRSGGSFGNNIKVYAGGKSWQITNGSARTEL